MLNNKETFITNFPADEIICAKEVDIYNSLFLQTKDSIIKASALKLDDSGKYDGELHKISASLVKLYPGFSTSTISLALDDEGFEKYKRSYKQEGDDDEDEDPDTPLSKFEEFIFILQDTMKSYDKSLKQIINRSRKDPKLKKRIEKQFIADLHKFHADLDKFMEELRLELFEIEDLDSLIGYSKRLQSDIRIMEKNSGERLTAALRFGLKLQFSKAHVKTVANKVGISSNILEGLQKSPEHKTIFDELSKCPVCSFDYQNYIDRAEAAIENDVKIPKPNQKMVCKQCGSIDVGRK